jgi:hypothetical protein
MSQSGGGAEWRKPRRVPMKLPVRVQGREADGTAWQERLLSAVGAGEKAQG